MLRNRSRSKELLVNLALFTRYWLYIYILKLIKYINMFWWSKNVIFLLPRGEKIIHKIILNFLIFTGIWFFGFIAGAVKKRCHSITLVVADPNLDFLLSFEMILVAPCWSLVRIVELCDAVSVTARLRCVSNGRHHGIPMAPDPHFFTRSVMFLNPEPRLNLHRVFGPASYHVLLPNCFSFPFRQFPYRLHLYVFSMNHINNSCCSTRPATRSTGKVPSPCSRLTGARTRSTPRTSACWPSSFWTTRQKLQPNSNIEQ